MHIRPILYPEPVTGPNISPMVCAVSGHCSLRKAPEVIFSVPFWTLKERSWNWQLPLYLQAPQAIWSCTPRSFSLQNSGQFWIGKSNFGPSPVRTADASVQRRFREQSKNVIYCRPLKGAWHTQQLKQETNKFTLRRTASDSAPMTNAINQKQGQRGYEMAAIAVFVLML